MPDNQDPNKGPMVNVPLSATLFEAVGELRAAHAAIADELKQKQKELKESVGGVESERARLSSEIVRLKAQKADLEAQRKRYEDEAKRQQDIAAIFDIRRQDLARKKEEQAAEQKRLMDIYEGRQAGVEERISRAYEPFSERKAVARARMEKEIEEATAPKPRKRPNYDFDPHENDEKLTERLIRIFKHGYQGNLGRQLMAVFNAPYPSTIAGAARSVAGWAEDLALPGIASGASSVAGAAAGLALPVTVGVGTALAAIYASRAQFEAQKRAATATGEFERRLYEMTFMGTAMPEATREQAERMARLLREEKEAAFPAASRRHYFESSGMYRMLGFDQPRAREEAAQRGKDVEEIANNLARVGKTMKNMPTVEEMMRTPQAREMARPLTKYAYGIQYPARAGYYLWDLARAYVHEDFPLSPIGILRNVVYAFKNAGQSEDADLREAGQTLQKQKEQSMVEGIEKNAAYWADPKVNSMHRYNALQTQIHLRGVEEFNARKYLQWNPI